jgi:arginine decarboxylase
MQDITCDSDGRIDLYVDGEGIDSTCRCTTLRRASPICSASSGGRLPGDPRRHAQPVRRHRFGPRRATPTAATACPGARGDTVDSVLRYVHFNADDLLASYRAKIERAKSLSAESRETYLAELSEGLKGYTYLED